MLPFSFSILPSSFPFYSWCKFYFLSSHCSDSQFLLVLLPLPSQSHFWVSHLIFALCSYDSLNLSTPLLILVHLPLILRLQGEVFLWMWVCSLGFVLLFWQHLHNSIQDMVGRVTLSQPAAGKNTPKNDPTTIKTQIQPESQHKWHPKSSKFRSRRLHHWISQVSSHTSSHHKLRDSEPINLRSRG